MGPLRYQPCGILFTTHMHTQPLGPQGKHQVLHTKRTEAWAHREAADIPRAWARLEGRVFLAARREQNNLYSLRTVPICFLPRVIEGQVLDMTQSHSHTVTFWSVTGHMCSVVPCDCVS